MSKQDCQKKPYDTAEEANLLVPNRRAYLCKLCGYWHTTSDGAYALFKAAGNPHDGREWVKRHTRSRKKQNKNRFKEE